MDGELDECCASGDLTGAFAFIGARFGKTRKAICGSFVTSHTVAISRVRIRTAKAYRQTDRLRWKKSPTFSPIAARHPVSDAGPKRSRRALDTFSACLRSALIRNFRSNRSRSAAFRRTRTETLVKSTSA